MLLLLLSCLPIAPAAAEPIPVVDFLPCLGPSTYRLLPTEHGMGVLCMADLYGQVVLSDPSGTQTWSLGQNARALALTQYSPRTHVDVVVQDRLCDVGACTAVLPVTFRPTPGVLETDLVWAQVGYPGAAPSHPALGSLPGPGGGVFVGAQTYQTRVLRKGSQVTSATGQVALLPGVVQAVSVQDPIDLVVAQDTDQRLVQSLTLATVDPELRHEPVLTDLGVQGVFPMAQVMRAGDTVHVVAQVSRAGLTDVCAEERPPCFEDGPSELILVTVVDGAVTQQVIETAPTSLGPSGVPSATASMRWDAALHGEVVWLLLGDADPATPPVLRAIAGVPTP
jgi:hypothetical protein